VGAGDAVLTEPYAAPLADDLVEGVLNEAGLTRAAASNAESGPAEPPSGADVSIFVKLAEGEGFEPSSEESPPKRFSRPPHSTALPPLQSLGREDERC
jgi:hypothetical protein